MLFRSSAIGEIAGSSITFWIPTYTTEHLGFSGDAASTIYSVVSLTTLFTPFITLVIYEKLIRNGVKLALVMYVLSAVFFIAVRFTTAPLVNVIIPAGIYRTGGLRLRSHVTLHLLSGAILEASENPEDYAALENDTLEPVKWEDFQNGVSRSPQLLSRWNHGIIRAVNATDIGIIGEPYSWIDGKNCFDSEGEEDYRGPHGINLWLCNYAGFPAYFLYFNDNNGGIDIPCYKKVNIIKNTQPDGYFYCPTACF